MNQTDIKKLLPHREPFLFIDSVLRVDETSITAIRQIREDAFYFKGHYPGNPIMPGVLLLEIIFQAGALLIASLVKDQDVVGTPVVTRVTNVKFKKIVRPNDELSIEAEVLENIGGVSRFKGKIKVDGKLAVSCEFMAKLA